MSLWQGANTSLYRNDSIADTSGKKRNDPQQPRHRTVEHESIDILQQQQQLQQQETVEAVLNRIIKSYNNGMECVKAFHRYDTVLYQTFDTTSTTKSSLATTTTTTTSIDDAIEGLYRVGRVARKTFEISIFSDPYISIHTPAWTRCRKKLETSCTGYPLPHIDQSNSVQITSTTHKSTIQQIAYLSLVNYADLLLVGLPSSSSSSSSKISTSTTTVLDRGIVQPLQSYQVIKDASTAATPTSCWVATQNEIKSDSKIFVQELEENTVRIALVSYIDATAIDGSDPTVWLKLACAARRLNRILLLSKKNKDDDNVYDDENSCIAFGKYRQLERYALERAVTAVPLNVPPNRLVQQAIQEWWKENDDIQVYTSDMYLSSPVQQQIVIDLPRYSWSTFGRMLLRVCKEGSLYKSSTNSSIHDDKSTTSSSLLLSPNVKIKLSPLLALPTFLLANIISFIPTNQLWRLDATCRAISASMVSARVILESSNNNKPMQIQTLSTNQTIPNPNLPMERPEHVQVAVITTQVSQQPTTANETINNDEHDDGVEQQAKRKSKRVRSQMITSGKRNERMYRRNSIEYCFVASILGCTIEDSVYKRTIESYQERWTSHNNTCSNDINDLSTAGNHPKLVSYNSNNVIDDDSLDQLNESSLYMFISQWSANSNLTAVSGLFQYIAHVSIYTKYVFTNDAGLFDMHSHILDCIEWMNHRTNLSMELIPCWSLCIFRVPQDSLLDDIEIFAIDLLHAELRLRRCEFDDSESITYDCDGNFTSQIIPTLFDIVQQIDRKSPTFNKQYSHKWKNLKIRYYWLSASWYFWRGSIASNVSESRQAEKEGLHMIEETKKCFLGSESVSTPHLSSAIRKGQHWKELSLLSLSSFTDEVQAAAVVLLAQEQFLEVATSFANDENTLNIEQAHCDALSRIGDVLMQRYSCTSDNITSKYFEIIENFFNVHGEQLSMLSMEGEEAIRRWFLDLIPSKIIEPGVMYRFPSSPSILTILTTCLQTNSENSMMIASMLSQLIFTLIDLSDVVLSRQKSQWDRKLQSRISGDAISQFDSDIDDDFLSEEEDDEIQHGRQKLSSDDLKLQKYSVMIRLLLRRIVNFYHDALLQDEVVLLKQSDLLVPLIRRALSYTADLFPCSHHMVIEANSSIDDLGVFVAVQDLFQLFQSKMTNDNILFPIVARSYVEGIFHIIVTQRRLLSSVSQLKPNKNGRNIRLRAIRKRADLVAAASYELGCLCSTNLASLKVDQIKSSEIFGDSNSDFTLRSSLVAVCDSILWFWRAAMDNNVISTIDKGTVSNPHLSAYLDEFGKERLRVPVATAIIGLCGSAISDSSKVTSLATELVALSEFYDSDTSVTGLLNYSDSDDSDDTKDEEGLLRVIVQAVHCVSHVFGLIDEKEACTFPYVVNYVSSNGPGLPLVVCRVLNCFANRLLLGFKGNNNDDDECSIWNDYPYGTRSVGQLLDSSLWKAYKCLHGFTLTSETKESASSSGGGTGATGNAKLTHHFNPESKEAGAMLYRCIMRAYSQGRRSPPKAALESVIAALPECVESEKSSAIRKYLYSPSVHESEPSDLLSLALQRTNWEATFSGNDDFKWLDTNSNTTFDDEISLVRRGLSRLIAHGPIPRLQENGEEKDWRNTSIQSEEDLSTKFRALIDDLCFANTHDWEGWFKASQCLNMKSDVIADRLGLSQGFCRHKKFSVPDRLGVAECSYNLSELKTMQEHEHLQSKTGWIQSLGRDLSIFVRYHWSSLDDLKLCFKEMGQYYGIEKRNDDDHSQQFNIWQRLNILLDKNDFARWQQALGGLFVSSLRRIAYRCLSLALFLSNSQERSVKNKLLLSELVEALGVNLYTELMGSQTYGFPMTAMANFRKRHLASDSFACFKRTKELIQADDDSVKNVEAWDILFMMGKCQEKVASTFKNESFGLYTTENQIAVRMYEHHMSLALSSYSSSITNATLTKETGGFIEEQNGGSAHGMLEAFYRLHATRLKCLISAVDRSSNVRELAEIEALRLTECHWYHVPESSEGDLTIRQRVWRVLVDVVGALAQCALDNNYFHRSVYRHAQALMWTPALFDPDKVKVNDNTDNIPATLACAIRGLNSSSNAPLSAFNTLSSLFTKKRAQLVAVWVTMDGETTAFQTINSSARKYDSLRGKYIGAYVDCLRLCRRRKELDIFLSWTTACPRDLPSYFAASAAIEGGTPIQLSSMDNLEDRDRSIQSLYFLKTVRRLANSALANVIYLDMIDWRKKEASNKPVDGEKFFETQLKLAYACFLRLNCNLSDVTKRRSWIYQPWSGVNDVVEALTFAYTNVYKEARKATELDRLDWSGENQMITTLVAAVQRCKELYPSMSRNFSFTRQRVQQKPKNSSVIAGSKRKLSPDHEQKSFEVAIPEGLKDGETFLTSIKIGDETKRIRLTVPSETASSLRFSLQVPKLEDKKSSASTPIEVP